MKNIRLSLIAGSLMLALALPAFAGYMDTTVVSPPSGEPTAAGDMSGPVVSPEPMMEIALGLAQSMLSLF